MTDHLAELEVIVQRLRNARQPEDVFGVLKGTPDEMLAEGKRIFRHLAQQVHPDARPGDLDDLLANEGFMLLNKLWEVAQIKIINGMYGKVGIPIVITTRKREYTVLDLLAKGDLANLYHCNFNVDGQKKRGVFKVAREAYDNDLLAGEADILRYLARADIDSKFGAYLPKLVESFSYRDADTAGVRHVSVLAYDEEIASPSALYSLKEVRDHYHNGIDPRDMAWIWRRVLMALGFAHQNKVIHGAVLPTHILIQPELHGMVLVDWAYTVRDGECLRAVSADYEAWYPQEVWDKTSPLPGLDIFMAAKTIVYLIGGDPVKGIIPNGVPTKMKRYFEWCMQPAVRMRPQKAWQLLEEFDQMLEGLWGPRRFREFIMPKR
jgi:curved DNA-binding protein CbpA